MKSSGCEGLAYDRAGRRELPGILREYGGLARKSGKKKGRALRIFPKKRHYNVCESKS
jgi:hypothetical protein